MPRPKAAHTRCVLCSDKGPLLPQSLQRPASCLRNSEIP